MAQPQPADLTSASSTSDVAQGEAWHRQLPCKISFTAERTPIYQGIVPSIAVWHPLLGKFSNGVLDTTKITQGGMDVLYGDMARTLEVNVAGCRLTRKEEVQQLSAAQTKALSCYGQEMNSFFGEHVLSVIQGLCIEHLRLEYDLNHLGKPDRLATLNYEEIQLNNAVVPRWDQCNKITIPGLMIGSVLFPRAEIQEHYLYQDDGRIKIQRVATDCPALLDLMCSIMLPEMTIDSMALIGRFVAIRDQLGAEGQHLTNIVSMIKKHTGLEFLHSMQFLLLDLSACLVSKNLLDVQSRYERLSDAEKKRGPNRESPDEMFFRAEFRKSEALPLSKLVFEQRVQLRKHFCDATSPEERQKILETFAFSNAQLLSLINYPRQRQVKQMEKVFIHAVPMGLKNGADGLHMWLALQELQNNAAMHFRDATAKHNAIRDLSRSICAVYGTRENLSPAERIRYQKMVSTLSSTMQYLAARDVYNATVKLQEFLDNVPQVSGKRKSFFATDVVLPIALFMSIKNTFNLRLSEIAANEAPRPISAPPASVNQLVQDSGAARPNSAPGDLPPRSAPRAIPGRHDQKERSNQCPWLLPKEIEELRSKDSGSDHATSP